MSSLRYITCACGEKFETWSGNAKRCPDCRRLYRMLNARVGGCSPDTKAVVDEEYARYIDYIKAGGERDPEKFFEREFASPPPKVGNRGANLKSHRCPYCGRNTRGKYCMACTASGMHWVHQVTGRTNGWNIKKGKSE